MSFITKAMYRYSVRRYINFLNKNALNFKVKQNLLLHSTPFFNVKGQEITMPSLSPTMSEGKIVRWFKKEGDIINPGDVLCDIETDKAVVPLETEEEGILAKILITENSKTVSVGTSIALMVLEGEDWTQVELPSQAECVSTVNIVSGTNIKQNSYKIQDLPSGIPVKMPSLSPTMKEGTIVKWHKKEGDLIAAGDLLCDIQTDKAIVSLETDEEGILAKILIPEDVKGVQVGSLIALIVNENEDWKNIVLPKPVSVDKTSQTSVLFPPQDIESSIKRRDLKSYGPAVRSLLSLYQLDCSVIKATGKNNTLLKEDVLKYIEENKLQKKPPKSVSLPTSSAPREPQLAAVLDGAKSNKVSKSFTNRVSRIKRQTYIDVDLTNIRRIIAKRLTESKYSIPHAYISVQCSADSLLALRKEMTYKGITVSVNDYIIKATGLTLKSCPRINIIKENDEYKHSHTIDVAVAVATPTGLITPIIQNVTEKKVNEISELVKELAGRARKGKLKPHEFQGGSFTVSNLGMYGIKQFTAIINPPQAAILAVGCIFDRYGVDRLTHKDMIFTLSYDKSALQEDEAAEFLEKLKALIENPKSLVAENISVARSLGI